MAPRITPAKLTRWQKRMDAAKGSIEAVLDEVVESVSNPKAKHYQDLCDLRVDLRRVQERMELCQVDAGRIRP